MRIRRLPLAIADVDSIWLYIAERDAAAATRIIERITSAIARLGELPHSGRTRSDIAADARSIPVGSYLILYRITLKSIEIVRIVDGRRRLEPLWREPG